MTNEELLKALRHCMTKEDGITICEPCPYCGKGIDCENVLHTDATAAIEALLSFAHYVADKVTMSDEDWEDYHEAFTEVACRKLVKLGVISIENGVYAYGRNEPPKEENK